MPRRLHGMIMMDLEYASRLWDQYVGQQSPQEFMRYSRGKTIREAVDEYIEGLDGMFGEGTAANAPGDLDDALASYIESEIAAPAATSASGNSSASASPPWRPTSSPASRRASRRSRSPRGAASRSRRSTGPSAAAPSSSLLRASAFNHLRSRRSRPAPAPPRPTG